MVAEHDGEGIFRPEAELMLFLRTHTKESLNKLRFLTESS